MKEMYSLAGKRRKFW